MPLTDSELYEGFTKEEIERYSQEVRDTYDPKVVSRVNRRIRNLSKEQWQEIQQEGIQIAQGLGMLMMREPTDPDVQILIALQHAWIENFFLADADTFRGLGTLYASNAEFRAHYDQFAPGLADFLCEAMEFYAEAVLSNLEK